MLPIPPASRSIPPLPVAKEAQVSTTAADAAVTAQPPSIEDRIGALFKVMQQDARGALNVRPQITSMCSQLLADIAKEEAPSVQLSALRDLVDVSTAYLGYKRTSGHEVVKKLLSENIRPVVDRLRFEEGQVWTRNGLLREELLKTIDDATDPGAYLTPAEQLLEALGQFPYKRPGEDGMARLEPLFTKVLGPESTRAMEGLRSNTEFHGTLYQLQIKLQARIELENNPPAERYPGWEAD